MREATACAQAPAIRSTVLSMRAAQGRARQFWRVFAKSLVPMVIVDNRRRYVGANAAARLLFRLSLAEIRQRRIDDLTPVRELDHLHERWDCLMRDGVVSGPYDVGFPDGSQLSIIYCALTNILPGQHLIVFLPAAWPGDELALFEEPSQPVKLGGLSRREREVLSLIATGATLEQIADDLTVSVSTVRTHARNALRKLGARNRAHAIALAMRYGLIEAGEHLPADPASPV